MRRTGSACLLAVALTGIAAVASAADLVFVGARVVPSPHETPIENAVVLVSDGRIAAVGRSGEVRIPAGVQKLDATGRTVVAGFWNSHVHLLEPAYRKDAQLPAGQPEATLREQYGRWGFTTIFDLASVPGDAQVLAHRLESGELRGPRVLSVGAPFYPLGGTPIYVRALDLGVDVTSAEVPDVEAGRARAMAQLDQGLDGVKLFTGSIVGGTEGVRLMDASVARAIAEVARERGRPVFAHATDAGGLVVALQARVDVLAHATPEAGPWSTPTVSRLVREDVALVPTLAMFEIEIRRGQAPEGMVRRFVGAAQSQVSMLQAAGGSIVFGTDAGYIDQYDTTRELQLLAGAGLDWRQILANLTTTPARVFGEAEQRGRIAPGMAADLVVLDSDPARGAEAFADVAWTLRGGEVIYRKP
jgi:Imidazolonepropionase and related amidohydrolases